MGLAVVTSEIIETIRQRADLPTFSATTSITSAEVLSMVKRSCQRLSAIVAAAAGDENYFTTSTTLTTTAGVDLVSLPTNAQAITSIYWVVDSNVEVPLERMDADELGDTRSTSWGGRGPKYVLKAQSIQLRPEPQAAYTLRVEYQTGLLVTATTDVLQMQFGWDELIVLDVVCKIKQRKQQPYADFAQEREKVEADVRSQVKRDRFRNARVRDRRNAQVRVVNRLIQS